MEIRPELGLRTALGALRPGSVKPLLSSSSCNHHLLPRPGPLGLLLPSVYQEKGVRARDYWPTGQGGENTLESGPYLKADKLQG